MSWSIIICAANREKRLAATLIEAGHTVFLPLRRTWRGKFAKHAAIYRPVIPNYVFAAIEPHQIHAFHNDGAIRLIVPSRHEQTKVDWCIAGWQADIASGVFDDPEPATKAKPIKRRNRAARREKQRAVGWAIGLEAILSQMTEVQSLAA